MTEYDQYIARLDKVKFTPTLERLIHDMYDQICDISSVVHKCSLPQPEPFFSPRINYKEDEKEDVISISPDDDDDVSIISKEEVLKYGISPQSCFSILSTPFSYTESIDEYSPEVVFDIDDFVMTPGGGTLCNPSVDRSRVNSRSEARQRVKSANHNYEYFENLKECKAAPRQRVKSCISVPDQAVDPYPEKQDPREPDPPTMLSLQSPLTSYPTLTKQNPMYNLLTQHDRNKTLYYNVPGYILQNQLPPYNKSPKSPFDLNKFFTKFSPKPGKKLDPLPPSSSKHDKPSAEMLIRSLDCEPTKCTPRSHPTNVIDDSVFYTTVDHGVDIDESLNVLSNCDDEDVLLPALLKEDVWEVERRLLFYFRQLRNIKYCYDIVEKVQRHFKRH